MTRRDMIIVAILVNAGLLAILFMMAINSDTSNGNDTIEVKEPIAQLALQDAPAPASTVEAFVAPTPVDEGDTALKEFNAAPVELPIIAEDGTTVQEQGQELTIPSNPDQVLQVETPKAPSVEQVPIETPKKSKENPAKTVEVTVKKGDSLDKIARANGTTIKAIKTANDLKNSKLKIGQVLKVPVGTKKKAAAKPATTASKDATKAAEKKIVAENDAEYYTIKSGDNPWKIAKKFNIKVDDFLKLNNLNDEKARNMKAGDKVRVK